MDELLKKDNQWNWNNTHQFHFNKLKQSLTSNLLLTHYNPKLNIIISADVSIKGIGAGIQHETDLSIKPVAFASRTLQPAEKAYSQIEKEGLALIFAVKKIPQIHLWPTFHT